MKSAAHIELHYLPCQAFLSAMMQYKVQLELQETYQKRSFRNKCIIASAQGLTMLTVPLKAGKHQQRAIKEVEISYAEDWRRQHLRTIHACYRSAPYYAHYIDSWEKLLKQEFRYLVDLNLVALGLLCSQLGIPAAFEPTTIYAEEVELDLRDRINPRTYTGFPQTPYQQVFAQEQAFAPNLSTLDLLFCTGPEARTHLSGLDAYL